MVSTLRRTGHPVFAVLLIGVTVWLLDGTAAVTNAYIRSGVAPEAVFKYISSALFGKEALSGGTDMAVFGIAIHFVIALAWSALFFFAYPRIGLLQGNKLLTGCLYGLFVWAMMSLVIVPLTETPKPRFTLQGAATGWFIHMLFVGLPIVLLTAGWYLRKFSGDVH